MTTTVTEAASGPYFPNGVTTQFPFDFKAAAGDELAVVLIDPLGAEEIIDPSGYSVAVALDGEGGTVTLAAAPLSDGRQLWVLSDPSFAQSILFEDEGPFNSAVLNPVADRSAIRDIWLRDRSLRSVMVPRDPALAAGKFPIILPDGTVGWSSGTGADAGLRGDLASIGGTLIYTSAGVGLPAFSLQAIFRDGPKVLAHYFRKPTDPDDTLAVRRAIDTGHSVHLSAGRGSGDNGAWLLKQQDATGATSLINRSNIELSGDGIGATVIMGTDDSYWTLHCSSNSSDNANNRRYLHIHDLSLVGRVATKGFEEHTHLLSLSGVSNVMIERCAFIGFQGDGVYIGQGNIGGQEIHNERVTIRDCYFDGVNNNNRNGVSFIDCITSLVENCTFVRCSRPGQAGWDYPRLPDGSINFPAYYAELAANKTNPNWGPGMPGPIDYEPDGNNAKIIDATVRGCIFWGCSGNVGTIGVQIPPTVPKGNIRGLLFEGNTFQQNFQRGFELHVHIVRALADPVVAADAPNQIIMRNNKGWGGYNGQGCVSIFSAKDVLVEGNTFTDYDGGCLWGYVADSRSMKTFGVRVVRNRWTRCGKTNSNGIMNNVFDAEALTFEGNVYDDCGNGSGFSYVWDFNAGTSKGVAILNNVVTSATGKTSNNIIIKEAAHTYTPGTNRIYGNDFGGKVAFFNATRSDIGQSYVPVVEGGTTPGAATAYTRQVGLFTMIGNWVKGYAEVVITGHSGNGPIEIGLPVDPLDLNGLSFPATVVLETTGAGVPGANKQIVAQVHGFADAPQGSGLGSVRLYTVDVTSGVKAPLNLMNVAYSIFVNFEYQAAVQS